MWKCNMTIIFISTSDTTTHCWQSWRLSRDFTFCNIVSLTELAINLLLDSYIAVAS